MTRINSPIRPTKTAIPPGMMKYSEVEVAPSASALAANPSCTHPRMMQMIQEIALAFIRVCLRDGVRTPNAFACGGQLTPNIISRVCVDQPVPSIRYRHLSQESLDDMIDVVARSRAGLPPERRVNSSEAMTYTFHDPDFDPKGTC